MKPKNLGQAAGKDKATGTYGIIDCGSNTVRLCVYRVQDGGKRGPRKKDIQRIADHKTMAGLASYVEDGRLSDAGMRRAARAVRDNLKRAAWFDCERIDVFATAFLRNCGNRAHATHEIERLAGVPVAVLSGADESHLGFVGARIGTPGMKEGALIDIGGGSCEVTRIKDGKDHDDSSLPIGSLSSFSQHVHGILPTLGEAVAIRTDALDALSGFPEFAGFTCPQMFAAGGSMRAAARVAGMMEGRRKPATLTPHQLRAIVTAGINDANGFARIVLKAAPERIHTIVPGCVIALALMERFQAQSLRICPFGVREGYLVERMLKR